jgi:hypothetical protein
MIEEMTANTHRHGAAITPGATLLVVGTGPADPSSDDGPSPTARTPDGAENVIPLDGPARGRCRLPGRPHLLHQRRSHHRRPRQRAHPSAAGGGTPPRLRRAVTVMCGELASG